MTSSFVANRVYTQSPPNQSEKSLHFYDLSYLSIINVVGAKAAEFLQGQISADIHEVTTTTIRQAALCNLQGRIKALIDVIYWQDTFKLILPKDLAEETIKTLTMAANLARVKLHLEEDLQIIGIVGSEKSSSFDHPLPQLKYEATAFDSSYCYAIDTHCFLLLILKNSTKTLSLEGSLNWHQYQLSQKRIEIYPESAGLFLPHRLDLHLSGYLNFNKGCYKGQEIIARMQYRGKQKHTLQTFRIETRLPLKIGMKLKDSSNQEVGELVDYCPLAENQYLITASIIFDYPDNVSLDDSGSVNLRNCNLPNLMGTDFP